MIMGCCEDLLKCVDWGGQVYGLGRIMIQGYVVWIYGFYEICVKLLCMLGIWLVIWMMFDSDVLWFKVGEIDIMEVVGVQLGVVYVMLYIEKFVYLKNIQCGSQILVLMSCLIFYCYQMEWILQVIMIGVDDCVYFCVVNDILGDCGVWLFDVLFYMIFNFVIGGDWLGKVDDV